MNQPNLSSFIWSVADLLRGDYKQSEYGKVILPFTVLRRLDCVLDGTKEAVLNELEKRSAAGVTPEPFLIKKSGQLFYNTSPLDMKKLMGDQDHIKENLFAYVQGFSPSVKDIFECFDFYTQVDRLAKAGLLYLVSKSSPISTCIPMSSAKLRWVRSSKNSFASLPNSPTKQPASICRRAKSSASW